MCQWEAQWPYGQSAVVRVGDIVLCSWARHFTLTVPLSTQVYKWVPAKSRNTSTPFMLRKPEISVGLMGLPRLVTETLPLCASLGLFFQTNRFVFRDIGFAGTL